MVYLVRRRSAEPVLVDASTGAVIEIGESLAVAIASDPIPGPTVARIDRLEDSIKDVLFSASVIGREFSSPLLEQVIERRTAVSPSLDELQTLELILPKVQAQESISPEDRSVKLTVLPVHTVV